MKSNNTLNRITLERTDDDYPFRVKNHYVELAPELISYIGNMSLLESKTLGIIGSVKCPGDLIIRTFDFANALCDTDWTVVSGFQSPVEKECLRILDRGNKRLIMCPSRNLTSKGLTDSIRKAITEHRMLLISPFEDKIDRTRERQAPLRNEFVCALSNIVFIPFASPNGKTEQLALKLTASGKRIYTFDNPHNSNLIKAGCIAVESNREICFG